MLSIGTEGRLFGHNIHGPKIGGCAPLGARSPSNTMWSRPRPTFIPSGTRPTFVPSGIIIHPAVWPQQTWDKKWGGCCAPILWGQLGPHITQCHLSLGLPPYQVASWSIQPFGHNGHGLKIGEGGLCPFGEWSWSPCNTWWPGPRPTSMPSFILIHPTVWPQYTNITDRTTVR